LRGLRIIFEDRGSAALTAVCRSSTLAGAVVSDLELLAAWRAGDQDAGEALFSRHFAGIARFFRNKIGGDIEELIQRTFLGCLEGQQRFAGTGSFRGYLFGIARNVLFNSYRDAHRAAGVVDLDDVSVHDLAPTASTMAARHEEERLLLLALRRLPLQHQIVLELSFWEDMTHAEIAEVLAIPEGTASTRMRRAKQLLAEQLATLATSPELRASLSTGFETWARSLRAHNP
jgi:RNA polymerase sigma factor (sigma-70 family)